MFRCHRLLVDGARVAVIGFAACIILTAGGSANQRSARDGFWGGFKIHGEKPA